MMHLVNMSPDRTSERHQRSVLSYVVVVFLDRIPRLDSCSAVLMRPPCKQGDLYHEQSQIFQWGTTQKIPSEIQGDECRVRYLSWPTR